MSKFTPGPWEYLSEIEYCHDHPFSQAHRVKIGQETLTCGRPGSRRRRIWIGTRKSGGCRQFGVNFHRGTDYVAC